MSGLFNLTLNLCITIKVYSNGISCTKHTYLTVYVICISPISTVIIVRLQRDYIYDAIIHFIPDFFRIRYHLLTENKFQKLIACRFLISFINNVRLQCKKCIFECRFCYWFDYCDKIEMHITRFE